MTEANGNGDELRQSDPWRMMPYKNVIMFEFSTEIDKFPDFKIRDDDVWVCSFPRSGTTMTLEMVYLIQTLQFEKARQTGPNSRTPWFDVVHPFMGAFRGVRGIEELESPRTVKSHLHHFLLPDALKNGKGKIVYVVRHPAAAALSWYNLTKFLRYCPADTLPEFLDMFLNDGVFCCPWWLHVLQYWEHRNDGNILFLHYEDIVKNKAGNVRKIADFLGKNLTEEQVQRITEQTDIQTMKGNENFNLKYHTQHLEADTAYGGFINHGSVDRWRHEVTEDLQARVNQMVRDRLGYTDLQF